MSDNAPIFFTEDVSQHYDSYNSRLSAIGDNLHLLTGLALRDLPEDARILCVGVGTGTEILRLAEQHPEWQFSGIDPSAPMLAICQRKLTEKGLADRCRLTEGYLEDLAPDAPYDAVLCLLVAHFLRDLTARQTLFDQMAARLRPGGLLIQAEIAEPQPSVLWEEMLGNWVAMHEMASQRTLDRQVTETQLTQQLSLLPPEETEAMMIRSGFDTPLRIFQSLLIYGWQARKPASPGVR